MIIGLARFDANRSTKANIAAAEASVSANQANVGRLQQLQGFEHIIAPFDGVITQRNIERGDLVSAAASSGSKPLFAIAQSDTLRVYVDVPQSEAVNIRDGQIAVINVSERLGRNYTGTITRNASALNDAARTMRTEVQVENRDASLLPGMYAQVHFLRADLHWHTVAMPMAGLFLAGLVLAWAAWRTGGIWLSAGLHAAWVYMFFLTDRQKLLVYPIQHNWLTGGGYPLAGWLGLGMILLLGVGLRVALGPPAAEATP